MAFPGCQQACQFHREPAPQLQSEPVIRTRGEDVLTVTPGQPQGGVARWKPALKQRHVSVECEVRLEAGSPALSAGTTVRVLVVDPEGLVTIYSPSTAPPTPSSTSPTPLESTKAPASSAAPQTKDEPTEPWHLREVSLLHQRVLVIAEVAWAPRARRGVYLVTWELDGGGLRGNLFTDSTSVTLSLWPDTIYHIQVELVSRGSGYKRPGVDRSDPMVIDTRKAPKVQAAAIESSSPESLQSPASSSQQQQRSRELLAGTGAAILVFLIVGGAVAWLCVRRDVTAATCCCSSMHKRRRLLADDSISAVSQPSIVSVLVPPKDCSTLGLSATSQEAPWPELPARPAV
ncbi:hypothetical protein B566_EDAN001524 [Ephemera danica]|nr:hypothetical protein B566_EDAN001524 [Ephemera danica]